MDAKNFMIVDDGGRPAAANASEAAHYIAALAAELARLAKRHDLDALAYILDMAGFEADQIARRYDRGGEGRPSP